MKHVIITITALILLFTIASYLSPSLAQINSFSLSITPPLVEITIQPGKKILYTFDIENHSPAPITLQANIVSFSPIDEHGHIQINSSQSNYPAANFFSLLNAHLDLNQPFTLKSHEKRQLILRIKIPNQTAEQDYYQTLLLQQINPQQININNSTQFLGGIGSNILLTVSQSGSPQKEAEIIEFHPQNLILGKFVDSLKPIKMILRFKNIGHAFFKPIGDISFQKTNASKNNQPPSLTLRSENILPDTIRTIKCLEGDCQFQNPPLFGSYQAKLNFRLEPKGDKKQARVTFWLLPLPLIGGLFFILILGIFFLIIANKKSLRR